MALKNLKIIIATLSSAPYFMQILHKIHGFQAFSNEIVTFSPSILAISSYL